MKKAFIVFCSPAGSTAHVARVIADSLAVKSIPVHLLDLGRGFDPCHYVELLKEAEEDEGR